MHSLILDTLQAAFILPLTAGFVTRRTNVGYHRHDGSIAGIVLLTSAIIFILETIITSTTRRSLQWIVGLSCLSTICITIIVLIAKCHENWTIRREEKPVHHIKLKFLWFFCIGNIVFQLFQFIMYQLCRNSKKELIVFWVCLWTFQIIQTGFIHKFTKSKFTNVLWFYYGLLILFVTNISIWTQQTVFTYRQDTKKTSSLSLKDASSNCSNGAWMEKGVRSLTPHLEPFLLEYSLLSFICLSKMWPRRNADICRIHLEETTETIETDIDERSELLSLSPSEQPRGPWNKNSIWVATIGVIYSSSFMVLEGIKYMYPGTQKHDQVATFENMYFFAANIVRVPLIIKCFFAMSNELRPKHKQGINLGLNQVIIIISSFATCGYYFLEYSQEYVHSELFYLDSFVRIIDTVLQTLFILQMKHYRKTGDQSRFCSIQNTFLFISIVNLGIWMSYTFVNPTTIKYTTHKFVDTVWFPFVIFYHFESFISFYKFFRT